MSGTIMFSSLRWCQKNALTVKHCEILFWMSKWQKQVLKEICCFYNLSLIFVAFPSSLLFLITFSDVSSSEAQNSGCKRTQPMFLPVVTSHSGSRPPSCPASSLPLSCFWGLLPRNSLSCIPLLSLIQMFARSVCTFYTVK